MADFNTHIFGAAALGSLGATLAMKLIDLPVADAVLVTVSATLAGVLPDIDLKHSTPGKMLFALLGSALALAWLFAHINTYTVVELWFIAVMVFLVVRYPLWWLFHQFTVHRGALHSLAATVMFSFATAAAGKQVLNLSPQLSWLTALFVAAGYLLHLLLDEIYSVDFMGIRIKRTFGSALKIIDTERLMASCVVLFVALVLWFLTPDVEPLLTQWAAIKNDWPGELLPDYLRR